jgi:hypothetical protein
MASIIRIKRSSVSGNPTTLGAGELAYSALTDNGSNGGDRLYIGMGSETAGNAASHVVIGGKYFTDMLDQTPGVLTASSALVVDSSKKLDELLVDNLSLNGNTISSTDTNGNIVLTPNGTGKTVITNAYIGDTSTTLAEYIYDTVGGAVTGTSGQIVITNSDAGNTSTIALATTAVTAGSYGSATAIPTFTVDAYGRLTAAGTASITTSLGIAGDTGTDTIALATDTLTFTGGTGITSTVSAVGNSVTFDIDNTVATLTGTQTLTNKTIDLTSNTLVATSAQLRSAVTDETGTGSLVFANTPTLVTPVLGVATATSINKMAITAPATGSTLAVADGKTFTVSNTLTFTGTDSASVNFAAGGTAAYTGGTLAQFASTTSSQLAGVISDETGSGALVFANTPTLVTPVLGAATATSITASSGNLTIAASSGNNSVNITPTGTGTVDVGSKRITSVAEPTQATDAATKNYVDAVKTGLDPKDSVRIATTANLSATYSNGTSGVGATLTNSGTQAAFTIDSIVGVQGDRVLIKDQATALQNGIYTITTVGTVSTNWVLTRAVDADQDPEVTPGAFTFVEEGTVNGDNGFVCTNNGTITIGTTGITFVQFSGAGQVIAGDGLTKSGNTLNAVGTSNRISISADAIDIASTYVGQTSITTLGTIGTGTWNGSVIGSVYGGTGVANGSNNSITFTGNYSLGLTLSANTSVTLPTSGTLATLAGTETLTNKTLTSPTINAGTLSGTFSGNHTLSGVVTLSNTTDATSTTAAGTIVSGGLAVAKAMYVGTNITGAGAATSTLDGFNIDGGTY